MAVVVVKPIDNWSGKSEIKYPEGTAWDMDHMGNLSIYNDDTEIGTHSSGSWDHVRTVELEGGSKGEANTSDTQE